MRHIELSNHECGYLVARTSPVYPFREAAQASKAVEKVCHKAKKLVARNSRYRRKAARPNRATRLALEAAILLAAPLKVVLAVGVVTALEASEEDGADREAVPAEAVPTGTRVVLLDTGYGAMGTALLSGTTGVAGAVLRRTAGVEEVALTTGATGVEVAASTGLGVDEDATTTGGDETTGVTIGATGDEETATGVALVAMTGCVKVQGQSVTVKVVACKGIRQSTRQIDRFAKMHSR